MSETVTPIVRRVLANEEINPRFWNLSPEKRVVMLRTHLAFFEDVHVTALTVREVLDDVLVTIDDPSEDS